MQFRKLISVALILMIGVVPLSAQEANLAACVDTFDAETDYFPAKAEIEYAQGFTIEYFGSYKVVTVTVPFPGATEADGFQYLLVQCGTPVPDGLGDLPVIEVPIDSAIVMSTTQLPHFTTLGLLDALAGVDSGFYISTPEILEKYEAGELVEVGFGSDVNAEVAVASEADVIFTYASGMPEYDAYPKLEEAGLYTANNAEYAESDPLGRTEWIKFTAAFFNKEAEAEAYFDTVVEEYNTLAALTADIADEDRPTVLWGTFSSYSDSWSVPGAETYSGLLLKDAGTSVILADRAPTTSAFVTFEEAYDAGIDADIWIPLIFGVSTLEELAAADERYADFAAFQNGVVFNSDGRVNANGGNDYYENGVNEPHVILADLIAIAHPDLLPDHELVYLRRME